jgi:hypothetical protein
MQTAHSASIPAISIVSIPAVLFYSHPPCFPRLLHHARTLGFSERPDYAFIRAEFERELWAAVRGDGFPGDGLAVWDHDLPESNWFFVRK